MMFMLRTKFCCTFLLLTVGLLASSTAIAQPHPPLSPEIASWVENSPEDVQLVELGNDIWVERLKGVAALAHLKNLMSKHPGAFANARESLREKGFSPTDHVYVERTLRLSSNDHDSSSRIRLAQDFSEQNAEGEILFWSWDDGNDNTWEGEIYVQIYSNNDASTWEGQIDASDSEHEWIYYTKTWEQTDPLQQDVNNPFLDAPQERPILAVDSPETRRLQNQYAPAAQDWLEWARCFRQSVLAWCSGGAVACVASNGGWPGCWGATCSGVLVGSAIGCY